MTTDSNKINAVLAEAARMKEALPEWMESLAAQGRPFGRFKIHAGQRQPWLLYASQQMLSLSVLSGLWPALDETRRQELLDVLLSAQDQETGLFVCPVVKASDTVAPDRWDATSYYRAITMKLTRCLG